MIRIAVIDSGVEEAFLSKPLEHHIFVSDNDKCLNEEKNIRLMNFKHGTFCALIIEKHLPNCALSSIRILDSNGTGFISKLKPALEWCLQHKIGIVNVNLGTTNFKDKNEIKRLINYYANIGLHIIAATANSGFTTYPASLSNVISVATGFEESLFCNNVHTGINFIAPSEHHVIMCGNEIITQKNNSYAAPYISAILGKLLDGADFRKHRMRKQLFEVGNSIMMQNDICYLPDWITCAYVILQKKYSDANFYFDAVLGEVDESLDKVDTIITDSIHVIQNCTNYGKHMVYIGGENPFLSSDFDRFFWKTENRSKQILGCKITKRKIEIPTIICEFKGVFDEIMILTELKNEFFCKGYNIYTVSFKTESVLYDLEFIPQDFLKAKYKKLLNSFIFWETYYNKSD
jgi:hypothetical protein